MKIKLNRKMIVAVSCLILVACAGNGMAVAQIERPPEFIKDLELYEICKADIKKENFDLTPCGMYVGSALSSYSVSKYVIISFSFQRPDSKSVDKFAKLISECSKLNFSTKQAAADYINQIDKKRDHISPDSIQAGTFFWYYFLSCGDISKIKL